MRSAQRVIHNTFILQTCIALSDEDCLEDDQDGEKRDHARPTTQQRMHFVNCGGLETPIPLKERDGFRAGE